MTQIQSPVLVHQMGKVGSSTIYRNLREQLSQPVFHTHTLNRQRLSDMMLKEPDPAKREFRFGAAFRVLSILNEREGGEAPIRIITGVREPVSRNISAYFENLGEKSSWSVESLVGDYMRNYPHNTPLSWFDYELRDVFGVDVFSVPFDRERGWDVISAEDVEVLIIRMENLSWVLRDKVVQDFLGSAELCFDKSFNRAEEKAYANLYRDFINKIDLPYEYLKAMLCSRYCRHFYSEDEREKFLEKWGGSRIRDVAG